MGRKTAATMPKARLPETWEELKAVAINLLLEECARYEDRTLSSLGAGAGFVGTMVAHRALARTESKKTREGIARGMEGALRTPPYGSVLAVAAYRRDKAIRDRIVLNLRGEVDAFLRVAAFGSKHEALEIRMKAADGDLGLRFHGADVVVSQG